MIQWNGFEIFSDLSPRIGERTLFSESLKSVNTGERSDIKDDDREPLNQETRRGREPARMASIQSNLENSTDEGRMDAAAPNRFSVLQPGEVS